MRYLAQSNRWRLEQATKAKPPVEATNGLSRRLGQFRQIFPLSFFPDELIVEELRVIWFRQFGPWTTEIVTIMATDIACVYASRGLIFGHIHVQSLTGGHEIILDKILRNDAYKARSLIEGIALSSREGLRVENENLETERLNFFRAGNILAWK